MFFPPLFIGPTLAMAIAGVVIAVFVLKLCVIGKRSYLNSKHEVLKNTSLKPLVSMDRETLEKRLQDKKPELSWYNFSDKMLRGLDFNRAYLIASKFRNAKASYCKFKKAQLENAKMRFAKLKGSCFDQANLKRAKLAGSNLSRASMKEANLKFADMRKTDLTGASLKDSNLEGATLRGARLLGTDLSGVNLQEVDTFGALIGPRTTLPCKIKEALDKHGMIYIPASPALAS